MQALLLHACPCPTYPSDLDPAADPMTHVCWRPIQAVRAERMQALLKVEASKGQGNFDAARMELLSILHSRVRNGAFQLISGRPTFYGTRWSYHIRYLTADQTLLSDMQG